MNYHLLDRDDAELQEDDVHTIELTDDELKLVRTALKSFLDDFTHEEKDLVREITALLAKLPPDE